MAIYIIVKIFYRTWKCDMPHKQTFETEIFSAGAHILIFLGDKYVNNTTHMFLSTIMTDNPRRSSAPQGRIHHCQVESGEEIRV